MEFHAAGAEVVQHGYQVAQGTANLSSFQIMSVSPGRSVRGQRARAGRLLVAPDNPLKLVAAVGPADHVADGVGWRFGYRRGPWPEYATLGERAELGREPIPVAN